MDSAGNALPSFGHSSGSASTARSPSNSGSSPSRPPQQRKRHLDELSKYTTIDGMLGTGSYGEVRKVRHNETSEVFAMKVIPKKKVMEYNMTKHLEREVKTQMSLYHPCIIRMHTFFEDRDSIYLILEYASGGSLFSHLRRRDKLTDSEAGYVFSNVIEALRHLHANDIIHRDLKPENILLCTGGFAKLADFGWCAELNQATGPRNTFCGTFDYLSPEMVLHETHDCTVDVWAAGVLLYEMLCGQAPFVAHSRMKALSRITQVDLQVPAHVSAKASNLIKQLLVRKPADRIKLDLVPSHPWMLEHGRQISKAVAAAVAGPVSNISNKAVQDTPPWHPSPDKAAADSTDAEESTDDSDEEVENGPRSGLAMLPSFFEGLAGGIMDSLSFWDSKPSCESSKDNTDASTAATGQMGSMATATESTSSLPAWDPSEAAALSNGFAAANGVLEFAFPSQASNSDSSAESAACNLLAGALTPITPEDPFPSPRGPPQMPSTWQSPRGGIAIGPGFRSRGPSDTSWNSTQLSAGMAVRSAPVAQYRIRDPERAAAADRHLAEKPLAEVPAWSASTPPLMVAQRSISDTAAQFGTTGGERRMAPQRSKSDLPGLAVPSIITTSPPAAEAEIAAAAAQRLSPAERVAAAARAAAGERAAAAKKAAELERAAAADRVIAEATLVATAAAAAAVARGVEQEDPAIADIVSRTERHTPLPAALVLEEGESRMAEMPSASGKAPSSPSMDLSIPALRVPVGSAGNSSPANSESVGEQPFIRIPSRPPPGARWVASASSPCWGGQSPACQALASFGAKSGSESESPVRCRRGTPTHAFQQPRGLAALDGSDPRQKETAATEASVSPDKGRHLDMLKTCKAVQKWMRSQTPIGRRNKRLGTGEAMERIPLWTSEVTTPAATGSRASEDLNATSTRSNACLARSATAPAIETVEGLQGTQPGTAASINAALPSKEVVGVARPKRRAGPSSRSPAYAASAGAGDGLPGSPERQRAQQRTPYGVCAY